VVVAEGVSNGPSSPPPVAAAPLSHPHLVAWREAFRAFGAKPKRYQCSAEALIRRIEAGEGLPAINRLVDLYNAVSVAHAVPVGGEDIDRVVGSVRLAFASGDEAFDGGDPPKPGEVVWADDEGVTCRRWNWRQGRRTRLELETTNAYFLFDALPVFDDSSLAAAMDDLCERLRAASPGARLETFVVS
jgi:DNA/RNA-binding domain of Phe-tRNA-synthetase-like protein